MWKKFIEFLQSKFFSTNKYDKFINELYNEDVIDGNDLDNIQNNYKDKEKDGFDK